MQAAEEELQMAMDIDTDKLEIRHPFSVPPWWKAPRVTIDCSPEAAVTTHNINEIAQPENCQIYTDGSGICGHIGCSAVSLTPYQVQQAYMGTVTESTVPLAEVTGLVLALCLAHNDNAYHNCDIKIYTDNQSALQTMQNPCQASGQFLMEEVINLLKKMRTNWPHCAIHFYWIPSHVGVPGNEAANITAKEATGWHQYGDTGEHAPTLDSLEPIPTQLAVDQWVKAQTKEQWNEDWTTSAYGKGLCQWLPQLMLKSLDLYTGLMHKESTVLIQLRTGKIGFQAYLHSIGISNNALCHCSQDAQTIKHILIDCPTFDDL
jgi:ribonuclease HI